MIYREIPRAAASSFEDIDDHVLKLMKCRVERNRMEGWKERRRAIKRIDVQHKKLSNQSPQEGEMFEKLFPGS